MAKYNVIYDFIDWRTGTDGIVHAGEVTEANEKEAERLIKAGVIDETPITEDPPAEDPPITEDPPAQDPPAPKSKRKEG